MDESSCFLACRLLSTYYTLCCMEAQVGLYTKVRVLPSGTLSQSPDLENFVPTYRSWKRVVDLARHGGRSERDKLDRRRSTKLTVPPSSDARPVVYRSDRQALSTARYSRAGHLATAGTSNSCHCFILLRSLCSLVKVCAVVPCYSFYVVYVPSVL